MGCTLLKTALLFIATALEVSVFDFIGAGVALVGMGIIVLGWRGDA